MMAADNLPALAGEPDSTIAARTAVPSYEGLLGEFTAATRALWSLLAALGLCCITIIIVGVTFINDYSREQSLHLAEASIERALSEIGLTSKDYSVWDEADEKLNHGQPDADWLINNLGKWAFDELNMQMVAVVDADDQLVFHMLDGGSSASPDQRHLTAGLLQLAQEARAKPWANTTAVGGAVAIDGSIYLAGATAVTPEKLSAAGVKEHRRSVLVFLRRLDEQWIEKHARDYLLPDLHLAFGSTAPDTASIPLRSVGGTTLAMLGWKPARPGSLMAMQFGPWLILLVAVGAAFAAVTHRHTHGTLLRATALIDVLEDQKEKLQSSEQRLSDALTSERKANAVKREFLAVMSHELRTPLNAVIGFSQTMFEQRLGPVGSPKYIDYAHDINAAGQHLLAMINDILEFSRADSGHLALEMTPVDLVDVSRFCLAQLRPICEVANVDIVSDFPAQPILVLGDTGRLRQILINLLTNAIKATADGKRIRLRIRHAGENVRITVTDCGIGIRPEDKDRIFEPFERATVHGLTYGEGVGLGLPIVKKLVNAHGGTVRLLSRPDLGTVAEVLLPLLGEKREAESSQPPAVDRVGLRKAILA